MKRGHRRWLQIRLSLSFLGCIPRQTLELTSLETSLGKLNAVCNTGGGVSELRGRGLEDWNEDVRKALWVFTIPLKEENKEIHTREELKRRH